MTPPCRDQLDDLIFRFSKTVAGVEHALVLSSDGIAVSGSPELKPEDSERLATVSAAAIGLAEGSTRGSGAGAVREVVMVMDKSLLFVTQLSRDFSFAVLGAATADLDDLGYEMGAMIQRLQAHVEHDRSDSPVA